MAEGATVEESALLVDAVTGEDREVDVVLRSTVAGYEVVVSVEASATNRRADVTWVEQQIARHERLQTNQLVLVSRNGFSQNAKSLAEAKGVVTMSPEDLSDEDPGLKVVSRLPRIWPKALTFSPERAQVWVQRPGEAELKWFRAPPDLRLFLATGEEIASLVDAYNSTVDAGWPTIMEQIGLRDVAEDMDRWFTLDIGPGWRIRVDGVDQVVHARWEEVDPPELHPIDRVRIVGKAAIRVSEVSLTHGRLGDVVFAYGEGKLGDRPALVVVTENEEGHVVTLRLPDDA